MNIKIQKNQHGETKIEIGGKEASYQESRELCGHTNEDCNDGVFTYCSHCELKFGEYVKHFHFKSGSLDFSDAQTIEKQIRSRVKEVRDWVKKCKAQAYFYEFEIR